MSNQLRLLALLITFSATALAQGVEERIRALEEANRNVLERLRQSEERNKGLESELADLRAADAALQEERFSELLDERINSMAASINDAEWSKATKSGAAMRIYGFVRLDAYYNTSRASDPVIPFRVLRERGPMQTINDREDQFAFDSRLTRLGFDFDMGQMGSADLTAKLETDFANFPAGSRESRATPRIRLAYIQLAWKDFTLRLGQDWDVISPLYPSVHSELLLWGAGNLGDRRPQVQALWQADDEKSFFIEASLGMSGAIDQIDNDGTGGSRTVADGFDSGHPHGQVRIGTTFDSWVEESRATVAVWGYVATLETDMTFGGEDRFTPYTIGIDFLLPITESVSLTGEAWYGQALSDVRGSILQNINTTTGEEIAGWGGWAEVRVQVSDALRVALGGSIDDPNGGDLSGASGQDRNLNFTGYVTTKYDFGQGLSSGFDVMYWETQYSEGSRGDMVRFNFWTSLSF